MVHPWAGTHKCANCPHEFKGGEKKIIVEDFRNAQTNKHFQVVPGRIAKCVKCAGQFKGTYPVGVETYMVEHKDDYVRD